MRFPIWMLAGCLAPALALAGSPQVLTNAQGLAQQDLSIRGGGYTSSGVSINGINLKVPYSAHYNASVPLQGALITDPQSQAGLDNISGHLTGTSALTVPLLARQSVNTIGIGTEERYRASTFGSTENIGGFIDWEKARTIDDEANDLERFSGGAFVQFVEDDWRFDILSANRSSRYGAQGYFGIPSQLYAEERTDDTLLIASAFKGDPEGSYMRAGVLAREFDRAYRIPSSSFYSDILSRYGSVMVDGRTLEVQHIALHLRGDLEHERVSGDIGKHDRTRGSLLLLPEARFERFNLTAGLNCVFQTDEAAEWLPQAGIDFHATDNVRLFASYTESVQQPDFQSLYYVDPYHSGNSMIGLQHARMSELGLQQFLSARLDWQLSAFHRRQENATDWVRSSAADPILRATELKGLDVTGIESGIHFLASEDLKLDLSYQWIMKDGMDVYAGLYELDYPEQLLTLAGFWQMTPELRLVFSQMLRYQAKNNLRSSNDFGNDASLGLHYDPRFANNVRLSFLVENLWDSDFQALPGLQPRSLSFSTGITVHW